jgi:hypothetical protein
LHGWDIWGRAILPGLIQARIDSGKDDTGKIDTGKDDTGKD